MDDLDNILNEIENVEIDTVEEKKEIEKTIDVTEFESLASELMKMTMDDRNLADKTFQLFYSDIALGRDKTKASAEAITKAVEMKIAAGRNIIDIMKLLKTEEKGPSVGLFFNSKKSGIDLENIVNEI